MRWRTIKRLCKLLNWKFNSRFYYPGIKVICKSRARLLMKYFITHLSFPNIELIISIQCLQIEIVSEKIELSSAALFLPRTALICQQSFLIVPVMATMARRLKKHSSTLVLNGRSLLGLVVAITSVFMVIKSLGSAIKSFTHSRIATTRRAMHHQRFRSLTYTFISLIDASSSAINSIETFEGGGESNLCIWYAKIVEQIFVISPLCPAIVCFEHNKLRNDEANLKCFFLSFLLSLPENKLGAHFFRL